jgi:outer membrane protein OmpA-like peptidoglycan-associated protein
MGLSAVLFHAKKRQSGGYIFPAILMATLSVGLFIVTLTQMQSATKAQFAHLNNYQRGFNIAYSALIEVLAEVQTRQWSNRAFKDDPVAYTRSLYGGTYSLLVEDHDPDKYIFNTKIRVKYDKQVYLFYWRLKYIPDLLDFARFTIPVYYGEFPPDTGEMSDFDSIDSIVDADLERKKANRDKAMEVGRAIEANDTIDDALEEIDLSPPGVMDGDKSRPPKEELEIDSDLIPSEDIISLVDEIEPGQEYVMRHLQYEFDSPTVNGESLPYLEAMASYLLENPDIKVVIQAYTDSSGEAEYNLLLSQQRAEEIEVYLIEQGIEAERLSTEGFGETRPIASNDTPEGRALNRRAEFAIVD